MNAATQENLRRKSAYVDAVQMYDDKPLPSLIELNLTELCNRSCVFCPRVKPDEYPNQSLFMDVKLAQLIALQLREVAYHGVIVLSGYGEPMLHWNLSAVVKAFRGMRVELVTNGDFLKCEDISDLFLNGLSYCVVSLYDGPDQIEIVKTRFKLAGVDESHYLLRDRWHTEVDGFGLKLTNRAGLVTVGHQDEINNCKPCHYLAYEMMIDWNGDVLMCPQDWHKRIRFGNVNNEHIVQIWNSPAMHKKRMRLIDGKRTDAPCKGCNTDGRLHGFRHVEVWNAVKR